MEFNIPAVEPRVRRHPWNQKSVCIGDVSISLQEVKNVVFVCSWGPDSVHLWEVKYAVFVCGWDHDDMSAYRRFYDFISICVLLWSINLFHFNYVSSLSSSTALQLCLMKVTVLFLLEKTDHCEYGKVRLLRRTINFYNILDRMEHYNIKFSK